ncbi:MAG: hypothetical protein R3C58_07720 [Parvularculaceae bacterium]
MNELMILGHVRELIDPLLIDQNPIGNADFLADIFRDFIRGDELHADLPQ